MKYLIMIAIAASISTLAQAEEDFTQAPTEVKQLMAEKAGKMGIDLSTPEGQKAFGKFLHEQRRDLAKKRGINLDTPNGERDFKKMMDQEFRQAAKDHKADMKTPEGREKVFSQMIDKGQIGMVPTDKKDFERQGWAPRGPMVSDRGNRQDFKMGHQGKGEQHSHRAERRGASQQMQPGGAQGPAAHGAPGPQQRPPAPAPHGH